MVSKSCCSNDVNIYSLKRNFLTPRDVTSQKHCVHHETCKLGVSISSVIKKYQLLKRTAFRLIYYLQGCWNLFFLFWICGDCSCPSFELFHAILNPLYPTSALPQTGVTQLCVFWVGEITEWMGPDPWETGGISTTLNKLLSTKREATTKPRLALWGIRPLMREASSQTWKWLMLRNEEAKNIPTAKIMCVWITLWFSPFHCHF